MMTTLLDKAVYFGDSKGKICTVYVDRGDLYVAVLLDGGSIITCLAKAVHLIRNENSIRFYVVMKWKQADKIKAIKTVRQICNMDLREAKEFVEAHPNEIVFSNKDCQEADTIAEIVRGNSLEVSVLRHENT